MMEKIGGKLEVGLADNFDHIVISHRDLEPDVNGVSHILLWPRHARHLANVLIEYAADAEAKAAKRRPPLGHFPAENRVTHGSE
ncbi:MAG: hypothetical protein WBC92_01225 [Terracidiphilus sp.]